MAPTLALLLAPPSPLPSPFQRADAYKVADDDAKEGLKTATIRLIKNTFMAPSIMGDYDTKMTNRLGPPFYDSPALSRPLMRGDAGGRKKNGR